MFDAVGGANIGPCIGALKRGGTLVGFGFMGAAGMLSKLAMFANLFVGARLRGRRGKFYGITMLYRKDPKPLREDLPKIFALLAEKKIDPLVNSHSRSWKRDRRSSFLRRVPSKARSCWRIADAASEF